MIKNLYLNDLEAKHIKLFNKIFKSEKKKYINYLTGIFNKQSNFKVISPFFNRVNNFNCVYPIICKTKLLKIILKNDKNTKYYIWSDDYTEYVHFKLNFKNEKIILKANLFKKIFFLIKPYIAIIYRFFYLTYFLFFEITNKSKNRKSLITKSKNIILVDTTLMKSSFDNKKNIYKDRFYGDIYKQKVKNCNFFLAPENLLFNQTKKYLKILDKEKINFIFRFDFLNILDYLKALKIVGLENLNFNKKFYKYQSIKLNYPTFIDKMNSKFNFNYYVGVLNYFFFEKLSKNKIKLKTIINWNENQSADKGFVLGAKKFFNKVPLKGFACYFVNYNYYFDKQPLACEFKNKLIPNNIFVPTKLNENKIKKFCKNIKIFDAPLFRFKNLFKIKIEKNYKITNSILVFLPIERKEAIYIIKQLSRSNLLKKNKIKVIVKPHPDIDDKFQNRLLKICQKRFLFSNKKLNEIIKKVDLVISTSSSTSIEAIFYGKPVISPVNSNLLVDSPIIGLIEKKYYDISYDAEDLEKKIMKYLFKKKTYNFNVQKIKKRILNHKEKIKFLNLIS